VSGPKFLSARQKLSVYKFLADFLHFLMLQRSCAGTFAHLFLSLINVVVSGRSLLSVEK
jgi:hypothetical protein